MVAIAVTSGLGILLIGAVSLNFHGVALLILAGWFMLARLGFIAGVNRFLGNIQTC
jgi:hypothetical protein